MRLSQYNWSSLRTAIDDPSKLLAEVREVGLEINAKFYERFLYDGGEDFMALDWDTLIILDACRYDLFAAFVESQSGLSSERLEARITPGTHSREFMDANFAGRALHDTVYVTANPHFRFLEEGIFHAAIDLVNSDQYWDTDKKTVLPETVADETIRAFADHRNKRFVVHILQPHFPFLGPTSETLESGRGVYGDRDVDPEEVGRDIWNESIRQCRPNISNIRRSYQETLALAMPHVRKIDEALPGRTVITADHGNLVGERLWPIPTRGFGHPKGRPVKSLVTVPWYTMEHQRRREITADPPIQNTTRDLDVVNDRLAALGYK